MQITSKVSRANGEYTAKTPTLLLWIVQEAKLHEALGNIRNLAPGFEARMLAAASPEQKTLAVAQMKKVEGGESDQGTASGEPGGLDVKRPRTLKI